MKLKSFLIVLVLPIAFGGNFYEAVPDPANSSVALVKKIVKDVTYKQAGESDWEVAKTGLPLKDGEEVKTGFKSLALILFTDGAGLMRVRENSILHIYGQKEGKKLNKNTFIQKGLIGFDVNKQEDEEFKFTTPTVVASIRGTEGFIEVADDSTTTISLLSGKVEFSSIVGEKESGEVAEGNTATIDSKGKIIVSASTEEDKNKSAQTRTFKTKKIKIKTNVGDVEIEYYSNQN